MENFDEIVFKLCSTFNASKDTVLKKKHGLTPEFTYEGVVHRILTNTFLPIEKQFPEIASRSTISLMLNKAFPGKTSRSQNWYTYILLSINMKKCTNCGIIADVSEFYGTTANLCKACESARHKVFYVENKDVINLRNRQYNKDNNEAACLQKQGYYQNHKAEAKARTIKRVLQRDLATPSWANLTKMNNIYKNRNYDEHVDHIIPLQGELVSGLHCEHNLQYLPIAENIAKSNNFDIDSYVHELPYF